MDLHKTGIEKKMPSSSMGKKRRDVCDRNTTRTHTYRRALRRKCHPVVWTSKEEMSVIEIPPEHIHTGGH